MATQYEADYLIAAWASEFSTLGQPRAAELDFREQHNRGDFTVQPRPIFLASAFRATAGSGSTWRWHTLHHTMSRMRAASSVVRVHTSYTVCGVHRRDHRFAVAQGRCGRQHRRL